MFVCFFYFFTVCLFPVLADDPIVTIIETNPIVDPVEGKIISEKNKDVQLTCVVENKPIDKEVCSMIMHVFMGIVKVNYSHTMDKEVCMPL